MRIAVGIATAGRPEILHSTLAYIAKQTRAPDRIIICPAGKADVDAAVLENSAIALVIGKKGLTCQRNMIIEAAADTDLLVFFDDDFFALPTFLEQAETLFVTNQNIVVATGFVLADGITTAGLSEEVAATYLNAPSTKQNTSLIPVHNAYGCNMAIRLAPVLKNNIRFDEALPLYGWLEDVDFSRRLAPFGRIVKAGALQGVHLGVKRGRNSGVKFGYSQIANPLYMVRKGTLNFPRALSQMCRNIAMNIVKWKNPEPWIDRNGRCKGNAIALFDLIRGRLSPGRILEMD